MFSHHSFCVSGWIHSEFSGTYFRQCRQFAFYSHHQHFPSSHFALLSIVLPPACVLGPFETQLPLDTSMNKFICTALQWWQEAYKKVWGFFSHKIISLFHLLHTVEWQVHFILLREKLGYPKCRKGIAQRYVLE